MGFLAAAAPFLMKAAPIALSMLGGKSKPGSGIADVSAQAKPAIGGLQDAQAQGMDLTKQAVGGAKPFLSQANQYIPQSAQYFQSILSGNRGAALDAFAPDLHNISSQFRSARQGIMAGPRGGGRTSALAQLPGQEAATKGLALSTARPQAAQSLLSAGNTAAGVGTSLLNTGTQGIYGTTNAAKSILDHDIQMQRIQAGMAEQQRQRSGVIGQSIFDLIQSLPIGKGGQQSMLNYGPGY